MCKSVLHIDNGKKQVVFLQLIDGLMDKLVLDAYR